MFKRSLFALAAITIFMSVATLAAPPKTGCRKFNFIGTYLAPNQQDVFGDGNIHKFAFQLTLSSDGTVNQYWTGLPDYLINAGTGSPQIGSWTCRDDGKLVIILIQGSYSPATPTDDPNLTSQDVVLTSHSRTTYLFTVDDDNTVTRTLSRTRRYTPTQDPTDPAGGTLLNFPATPVNTVYKRLTASDADLLAP
jgi:hypothetical protein